MFILFVYFVFYDYIRTYDLDRYIIRLKMLSIQILRAFLSRQFELLQRDVVWGQVIKQNSIDMLPSGWSSRESKSRGIPYYINEYTKETVWEKPTEAAKKPMSDQVQAFHILRKHSVSPDILTLIPLSRGLHPAPLFYFVRNHFHSSDLLKWTDKTIFLFEKFDAIKLGLSQTLELEMSGH